MPQSVKRARIRKSPVERATPCKGRVYAPQMLHAVLTSVCVSEDSLQVFAGHVAKTIKPRKMVWTCVFVNKRPLAVVCEWSLLSSHKNVRNTFLGVCLVAWPKTYSNRMGLRRFRRDDRKWTPKSASWSSGNEFPVVYWLIWHVLAWNDKLNVVSIIIKTKLWITPRLTACP